MDLFHPIPCSNRQRLISYGDVHSQGSITEISANIMFITLLIINWPWHSVDLVVMWWEWMKQGQGVSYFIYITQELTKL